RCHGELSVSARPSHRAPEYSVSVLGNGADRLDALAPGIRRSAVVAVVFVRVYGARRCGDYRQALRAAIRPSPRARTRHAHSCDDCAHHGGTDVGPIADLA